MDGRGGKTRPGEPSKGRGTKRFWPKVVGRANLPGVTPHTLRHRIGSASVSKGEILAMNGVLLDHINASSTSVHAHMQQNPAKAPLSSNGDQAMHYQALCRIFATLLGRRRKASGIPEPSSGRK